MTAGSKNKMNAFYNGFRRICAVLVGLVFFVAGMLKLMDPVGTMLIVQEYLKFFHITFLSFLAKPMAVALSFAECMIGVALISGVWRKLVSWITMLFVAAFTIITLILLIFNPEMDCGCFGEAIHLTHLQTFLKNVALCILSAAAFIPLKSSNAPRKAKYVGFGIATVIVILFGLHSLTHLPLVDFATFPPQTEIFAAYEDSGEEPGPILSFRDEYGDYCDEYAAFGPVMLISAYNPDKLSQKDWQRISDYVNESYLNGVNPMVLITAADLENVPMEIRQNTYMTDYRTAIGLNRSNGGVTYLEDGTIISKWPAGRAPSGEEYTALVTEDATEYSVAHTSKNRLWAQGTGIFCLAVLLLL